MINISQILEIKCLLQEGKHSQRTIALKTGVSRTAVKAVLRKILLENRRKEEKKLHGRSGPPEIVHPQGKPHRCPLCGGLVKLPCLACQLHEIRRRRYERP